MPTGLGVTFETQPQWLGVTFTSADTTVAKNIFTAPGGPWRVNAINITSDDTATINLDIFVRSGATNYLLGSVTVPAGSGKAGVAPVEFFAAIMPTSEAGIDLTGAQGLQAACEATMTAAKTCTVQVYGGLY